MRGNKVCGAMPLYLKSHSWGEFVFDHAWAEAFHRAGRVYYPKLVSCIPFTPVTGPRILAAGEQEKEVTGRLLADTATSLCRQLGASSLHVLFPSEDAIPLLRESGLLARKDCQYHWRNHDYRDFDHFLEGFRSARRKKLRRERRRVAEAGIRFRTIPGTDLDDDLLDTLNGAVSAGTWHTDATSAYPSVVLGSVAVAGRAVVSVIGGLRALVGSVVEPTRRPRRRRITAVVGAGSPAWRPGRGPSGQRPADERHDSTPTSAGRSITPSITGF